MIREHFRRGNAAFILIVARQPWAIQPTTRVVPYSSRVRAPRPPMAHIFWRLRDVLRMAASWMMASSLHAAVSSWIGEPGRHPKRCVGDIKRALWMSGGPLSSSRMIAESATAQKMGAAASTSPSRWHPSAMRLRPDMQPHALTGEPQQLASGSCHGLGEGVATFAVRLLRDAGQVLPIIRHRSLAGAVDRRSG
jgi:hypothetical protein